MTSPGDEAEGVAPKARPPTPPGPRRLSPPKGKPVGDVTSSEPAPVYGMTN